MGHRSIEQPKIHQSPVNRPQCCIHIPAQTNSQWSECQMLAKHCLGTCNSPGQEWLKCLLLQQTAGAEVMHTHADSSSHQTGRHHTGDPLPKDEMQHTKTSPTCRQCSRCPCAQHKRLVTLTTQISTPNTASKSPNQTCNSRLPSPLLARPLRRRAHIRLPQHLTWPFSKNSAGRAAAGQCQQCRCWHP